MALAAQLYRDDRGAERYRVEFDATLRDPTHAPLDVVIEDLSSTGFRAVTDTELDMGAEIGLGLAGIGTQRARIVWRSRGVYGCEFLTPLSAVDLASALAAPSTDPVALPAAPWTGLAPADPQLGRKSGLSPRGRLFAIVACAIAAWVVAVGLGSIVLRVISLVWPH